MFDGLLFALPGSLPHALLGGLFGLMIGSFLNVVIHRLPQMCEREWWSGIAELLRDPQSWTRAFGSAARSAAVDEAATGIESNLQKLGPLSLVRPHSRCPHCGHKITPAENIPVLSYLILRGRCRECKTKISARYPAVELLTGIVSVGLIWHFGTGWAGLGSLIFAYLLIAMTFIDLDTQLLPDDLTYPLLWLGLLMNLNGTFVPLKEAVIGAAAGYLALWSVYWLFKLIMRKEGMGYGDFKLLAALGAWMGWKMLPAIILLSSLAGAVIGISLIVFAKRGREVPIPFGPYLATAGMIALFYGKPLTELYLGRAI